MSDRRILYVTSFLRALATGMIGVLLAIYLRRLSFTDSQIGVVITTGLLAGTAAIILATFLADRIGRKAFLLTLTALSALGGVAAAASSSPTIMVVASCVGLLNGMGRDRGPAFVVEQAILPETVPSERRTFAFAWYSLLQDVGHALGGLLAAVPVLLREIAPMAEVSSFRLSIAFYAFLVLLCLPLYLMLSPQIEVAHERKRGQVSREGKRMVWKISSVFALDSISGGFLATALLALFFYRRFGVDEVVIGTLFFVARVANAISHPVAAWLAKHFGLLNTMVFTHIPSSIFLILAVLSPSFPLAVLFFLLREALVQMDVPTRQSYIMAVVQPEDRTYASGVTHIVRMGGWAIAPAFAGLFMQTVSLATPLFIGAGIKIGYDIVLYVVFRGTKPPEERADV